MKFFLQLFVYTIFVTGSAHGAVELIIQETAGINRYNDPVTYGVPLSHGESITSISNLALTSDKAGTDNIDAQFRVLSRYNDTPDGTGPIRAVLIDFQQNIDSKNTKLIYLQTSGGAGSIPGSLASISEGRVTIETGVLKAEIDNNTGWLSSVLIAADTDGIVNDQVLGTTSTDGFYIKSSEGKEYSSWNEKSTVTIEENGPLRCVIKTTGYFKDSNDNKLIPTSADNGLEYTLRFTFFKNKKYIKIAATLKNENRSWTNVAASYPTQPAYIDYAYLKLTSSVDDSNETVDIGGTVYKGLTSYSVHQNEISDGSTQSYTWVKKINGGIGITDQFESYIDMRDSSIGIMAGMRWFWQQHPKAFRVESDGNELYIDLWPNEAKNHRILGGIWKTHDVILYFHTKADTDFNETLAVLQNRLIARPDDVYIASTNFFYSLPPEVITITKEFNPIEPTLQDVISQDNRARRAKIDSAYIDDAATPYAIPELRSGRRVPGPGTPKWWTWYGWLEFGDFPRGDASWGYSAGHYDWAYSTLVDWIRFEDRAYFDLAEELIYHKSDISILHDQFAHDNKTWGGRFHGGHRYEHDALFSFKDTYSVSESNAPATGSHFWSKAIALQYLLTGDFRFLDSLNDTIDGRIYNYFTMKNCTSTCTGYALRDVGRSLEGIMTGYIVTGNKDYLTKALQVYKNAIEPEIVKYGSSEYLESPVAEREASLLQSGTTIEPMIQLYHALEDTNDEVNASVVKTALQKQGLWYRDHVYTHYACANGEAGDYIGTTDYIPYGQCKEWDADSEWVCGTCKTVAGNDAGYFTGRQFAVDLFAFLYAQYNEPQWLDLAESVFKDDIVYSNMAYSDQVRISSQVTSSKGWTNKPTTGDAWAKDGQRLKKGLYFLHTAWKSTYSRTAETPPASERNYPVIKAVDQTQ